MPNFNLQKLRNNPQIRSVIYESSMTSTSDMAKKQLVDGSKKLPLELLVLCDQQTAGHGQQGRSWLASDKSLTFSWCIAESDVQESNRLILPMIAGICVCNALKSIGVSDMKLKWPNDVLLENRKVCGILVEKLFVETENVFVVGVGINVNQNEEALGEMKMESRFKPGSVRMATGHVIDPQPLLETVLQQLQVSVGASIDLVDHASGQIAFLNQSVEFARPNGELVSGVLHGIDSNGHIQIQTGSDVITFTSGQIL